MRDPRKRAPWKYSSIGIFGPQESSEEPTPDPKYMFEHSMKKPEPPVPPMRCLNKQLEELLQKKIKADCEKYYKDLAEFEELERQGMVEDTSNTTPMIPDESLVRPLMEADERRKIWNEAIESAAITAWTHYMETCKNKSAHPANYGEFIASSAIRKLSK